MEIAPPRAYRSELRAAQAAQTRRRVLDAAARLFAAQGYQATTFTAIARDAGVSTETVKASGSKSALLIAAFEVTFSGTEGADSLTDTDAGAGVLELPDKDFLAAVIARIVDANARGHALWTVLLGAAGSDDLVAGALQAILRRRHEDYRMLVAELARRNLVPARAGGDIDALADEISFLMSPEGYQQLVTQSNWSRDRYTRWIGDRVLGWAGARSVAE